MDELIAAIKKLLGHPDRAEAAKLLKEHAGALHQVVFQEGFDVGYGKRAGETDTLKQQLATLTTERDTARTELAEARKGVPDVAKIHEQYASQINDLKTAHKTELDRISGTLSTERVTRSKVELRNELVAVGVDPDFAEVIAERPAVLSRITFDDAGTRQILQPGRDIPFAPTDKQSAIRQLAEALKQDVPAKFLVATTDRGSGDKGGAVPQPGTVEAMVKKVQDDAKAEKAAQQQQTAAPLPPALARMTVGSV